MTVLLEPELFDSQRFVEVQILPNFAHHVPIPGVGPRHRVTEGHYELYRSLSIDFLDTRCNLLGPVEVVGRGLSPHGIILRSIKIVTFVPVQTPCVILFSAEEHRLLDPGDEDLRVLGEIIVESRRTRLGGADYKEVRHPIEIRQAPPTSFSGPRYAARLAPAGSGWPPGGLSSSNLTRTSLNITSCNHTGA